MRSRTHARTYCAFVFDTRALHTGGEHSCKSECATHMLSACGRSHAFAPFAGSSKITVCSTELGARTQYCRSVHPRLFRSCKDQYCKPSYRVWAASNTAVQEQFVFRSATSTEDLYEASVLRAEAYYEVLLHNQCLHIRLWLQGHAAAINAGSAASFIIDSTGDTGATSCSLC